MFIRYCFAVIVLITPALLLPASIPAQTSYLSGSTEGYGTSCYGSEDGWGFVMPSGGYPPYYYQWSNGSTSNFIYGLASGTYTIEVKDQQNNLYFDSIFISQPEELYTSHTIDPIYCHGDSAQVSVSASGGQSPYTGVENYTLAPGSYGFMVIDARGCQVFEIVDINQPEELSISVETGVSGQVIIGASGGTPPYVGIGTFILNQGSNNFVVTDANGCSTDTLVPFSGIIEYQPCLFDIPQHLVDIRTFIDSEQVSIFRNHENLIIQCNQVYHEKKELILLTLEGSLTYRVDLLPGERTHSIAMPQTGTTYIVWLPELGLFKKIAWE